jgi:hypothetical protein
VTQVVAGEDRTVYLSAPDQTTAEAWLAAISALWPLSAARQEVSTACRSSLPSIAASVLSPIGCTHFRLCTRALQGTLRHHGLLKEMVKGGYLNGSVSLPPAHFASRIAEEDDRDAPAHATSPPPS